MTAPNATPTQKPAVDDSKNPARLAVNLKRPVVLVFGLPDIDPLDFPRRNALLNDLCEACKDFGVVRAQSHIRAYTEKGRAFATLHFRDLEIARKLFSLQEQNKITQPILLGMQCKLRFEVPQDQLDKKPTAAKPAATTPAPVATPATATTPAPAAAAPVVPAAHAAVAAGAPALLSTVSAKATRRTPIAMLLPAIRQRADREGVVVVPPRAAMADKKKWRVEVYTAKDKDKVHISCECGKFTVAVEKGMPKGTTWSSATQTLTVSKGFATLIIGASPAKQCAPDRLDMVAALLRTGQNRKFRLAR